MEKTLRDGLILRSLSATPYETRERLKEFYLEVYRDEMSDWIVPDDDVWIDGIFAGAHPTITDDDVWMVMDPAKDDKIVSSTVLIPQVWRYDSIELGVGRPELVLTHPDYRRRGLIRELMQVCHERSDALGHVMQGITGIAHYYRRFGYTMAVDLDRYATIPLSAVPTRSEDTPPKYILRLAVEADYAQFARWDDFTAGHFALSSVHDGAFWPYFQRHPAGSVHVIVDSDEKAVGYIALRREGGGSWIDCVAWVVGEQASLLATYDDVLHGIKSYTESTWPDNTPIYIGFGAGQLPAMGTLISRTPPSYVSKRPYAWYLRVADPVRFIQTIKPVLEQRLVNSAAHRYTGDLKINFYDLTGLRIGFEDGCIAAVETFELEQPADEYTCDAAFAYDTFLNVVFGHRNLGQLRSVLTETWANRKAEVLLEILFPLKPSRILPL